MHAAAADAQFTLRMYRRKSVSSVGQVVAKELLKLLEPLGGLDVDERRLLGQGLQVLHVVVAAGLEQEIVQGPGLGIGVGGRRRVAEPLVVGQQLLQAASGRRRRPCES